MHLGRIVHEVEALNLQLVPLQLAGAEPGNGHGLHDLALHVWKMRGNGNQVAQACTKGVRASIGCIIDALDIRHSVPPATFSISLLLPRVKIVP